MFIHQLSHASQKQKIARVSFANGSREIRLSGVRFRIYEPNFNGGSIVSNCRVLADQDLNVVCTLDPEHLTRIEQDATYLLSLIASRRGELKEPREVFFIETHQAQEQRKKFVHISVYQSTRHEDNHGDYIDTNRRRVEHYKFPDTKPFQQQIEDIQKELKTKYGLLESAAG